MMRIENITDITDESLQTLKASAIHEYIQESLKDASEKFTSEKQEKEEIHKQVLQCIFLHQKFQALNQVKV